MLAKNVAAERLNFALEPNFEPGAFQAQIQATDA
jgi:hypothetical protein